MKWMMKLMVLAAAILVATATPSQFQVSPIIVAHAVILPAIVGAAHGSSAGPRSDNHSNNDDKKTEHGRRAE
jgi:hypothetical protein